MKPLALLLLASCGGAATAVTDSAPCDPPAFTESSCVNPGGGVTRCLMEDGTYWDKQPTGRLVHWRWNEADPNQTITICMLGAQ